MSLDLSRDSTNDSIEDSNQHFPVSRHFNHVLVP